MHQNIYRIRVSLVRQVKYEVSYFLLILLSQLTIFSPTPIDHTKWVNILINKLMVIVLAIIVPLVVNFLRVMVLKLS